MNTYKELTAARLKELGLTMETKFIPFSQSRNAESDWQSLNWKVTVKRNDREVITTDYSAGVAHCPSYKQNPKDKYLQRIAISHEVENGNKAKISFSDHAYPSKQKIEPNLSDVIYSIVMDSDVLQYESFEAWAICFGYDEDSRASERIYNECLKTALQVNADLPLDDLRELYKDY